MIQPLHLYMLVSLVIILILEALLFVAGDD